MSDKFVPLEYDKFIPLREATRNKEIDLIQSIINRMSGDQYKIKGLCLAIIVIVCALKLVPSIICIITCCYWDMKILQVERLYRRWFEFIVKKRHKTNEWLFELNAKSIAKIMDSPTAPVRIYSCWSLYYYALLLVILFISKNKIILEIIL